MSAERYVPVSELPTFADFDPEVHRMSWDFSLPPVVDAERLVLNSSALRRIQTVAAFSRFHVHEYIGDTSEYDMGITGVSADGTATAGATKVVKKAETGNANLQDDYISLPESNFMNAYFRTAPVLRLNKPEIASRALDSIRDGQVREKAWAYELNAALRQSMKIAAHQHLMARTGVLDKVAHMMVYSPLIGASLLDATQGRNDMFANDVAWFGINYALLTLLYSARIAKSTGNSHLAERRWSLNPFYGWQPDRYLATVALNSVTPLIRYRK